MSESDTINLSEDKWPKVGASDRRSLWALFKSKSNLKTRVPEWIHGNVGFDMPALLEPRSNMDAVTDVLGLSYQVSMLFQAQSKILAGI